MKKLLILFITCTIFLFGGCDKENIKHDDKLAQYNIGEEIELSGVKFNIYKIDKDEEEIYLLAQKNIATTCFSDDQHTGYQPNSYEGSLIEVYVDNFVTDLEGVNIKSAGIIEEEDLYNLGFKHSDSLSGLPYIDEEALDFVKFEDDYWVGGYCKYQTRSWVYILGGLDSRSYNEEHGVRPAIIVNVSELGERK